MSERPINQVYTSQSMRVAGRLRMKIAVLSTKTSECVWKMEASLRLHLAEACLEALICAAGEETPCLLRKPKSYDCVGKNPILVHVLSQLNPAHMVPFCLLKINVVINLLSPSASFKWSFRFRLSSKTSVCM